MTQNVVTEGRTGHSDHTIRRTSPTSVARFASKRLRYFDWNRGSKSAIHDPMNFLGSITGYYITVSEGVL